jgi:hypothetical protein
MSHEFKRHIDRFGINHYLQGYDILKQSGKLRNGSTHEAVRGEFEKFEEFINEQQKASWCLNLKNWRIQKILSGTVINRGKTENGS